MAMTDKSAAESMQHSRFRSWRRWVLGTVVVALIGLGIWTPLWFHLRLQHKMRAHDCYNNFRQIGLLCSSWESENDGRWPRLSDVPGEFMFDPDQLSKSGESLRDYFPNMSLLSCPLDSRELFDVFPGDASYVYFGPGLRTEDEALAFLDEYANAALAGKPLPTPHYKPPLDPVKRSEIYWTMPVAFDRPENSHYNGNINVLFAEGHVETLKMGLRYPATARFWNKLADVEALIEKRRKSD